MACLHNMDKERNAVLAELDDHRPFRGQSIKKRLRKADFGGAVGSQAAKAGRARNRGLHELVRPKINRASIYLVDLAKLAKLIRRQAAIHVSCHAESETGVRRSRI